MTIYRDEHGRFAKRPTTKTTKKVVKKSKTISFTKGTKLTTMPKLKQYVGISRDHSGSMISLARTAMKDYNSLIADIKLSAGDQNIDTIVSTVLNGIGPGQGVVRREIVNSSVHMLEPLNTYPANGGSTPLWDSVGELIEIFENVPDYKNPDVSFLVMVVTDGGENSSMKWTASRLKEKIKQLQATDRWTFVFRVPRGNKGYITKGLGVYGENVIEWDTSSSRDLERTTVVTQSATKSFFANRSLGVKSTNRFYANMAAHTTQAVKQNLEEIKDNTLRFFPVPRDSEIREFIERVTPYTYSKGCAFYELIKTEDVQYHKAIVVRDNASRRSYTGDAARQMLGLPTQGTIRLSPGNNGKFTVFVQSTSTNRRLPGGTEVMYWPNATKQVLV